MQSDLFVKKIVIIDTFVAWSGGLSIYCTQQKIMKVSCNQTLIIILSKKYNVNKISIVGEMLTRMTNLCVFNNSGWDDVLIMFKMELSPNIIFTCKFYFW